MNKDDIHERLERSQQAELQPFQQAHSSPQPEAVQQELTMPKSVECPFCASEFVPGWLHDLHFYIAGQPAQQHAGVADKLVDAYCEAWKQSFTADNPFHTVEIAKGDRKHIEVGLKEALAVGLALRASLAVQAKDAIMGAAYDFRDAHLSGSTNLKRSAHASLVEAVDAALNLGPTQPAAVRWEEAAQAAHPNSDPEHWPDSLKVRFMAQEISRLRATPSNQSPQPKP